jgi:hypothetical protein
MERIRTNHDGISQMVTSPVDYELTKRRTRGYFAHFFGDFDT